MRTQRLFATLFRVMGESLVILDLHGFASSVTGDLSFVRTRLPCNADRSLIPNIVVSTFHISLLTLLIANHAGPITHTKVGPHSSVETSAGSQISGLSSRKPDDIRRFIVPL
jgi:hypothetical protein